MACAANQLCYLHHAEIRRQLQIDTPEKWLMDSAQARQHAEALLENKPLLGRKLARSLMCNTADALQALTEVIKFLSLAAENDRGMLTPSRRVDLAWHEFILYTRSYTEFCATHFGRLIHHEPGGEPETNRHQYQRTLELYRARYGMPDEVWWNRSDVTAAACGSCEATP